MEPPDFHACFEACIGNRWFIFDPTRRAALNGLIRIATGRDAADAAVATIFGQMQMTGTSVSCAAATFQPLSAADLAGRAIMIEPGATAVGKDHPPHTPSLVRSSVTRWSS